VVETDGDGAGDMVNAIGTRDATGRTALLVWNETVDVTKEAGDQLLDRHVDLRIEGVDGAPHRVRHRRLDERHSNLNATWAALADGQAWPDEHGWQVLREHDHLDDLHTVTEIHPDDGVIRLGFDLPMPAVSLIELEPRSG
jgi:xylan 1,4-beta-xylosidase